VKKSGLESGSDAEKKIRNSIFVNMCEIKLYRMNIMFETLGGGGEGMRNAFLLEYIR
jgi:hypothetical protein